MEVLSKDSGKLKNVNSNSIKRQNSSAISKDLEELKVRLFESIKKCDYATFEHILNSANIPTWELVDEEKMSCKNNN